MRVTAHLANVALVNGAEVVVGGQILDPWQRTEMEVTLAVMQFPTGNIHYSLTELTAQVRSFPFPI